MPNFIDNISERIVARLTSTLQRPRIIALARVFGDELQEAEDAAIDLWTALDPGTATGPYLDRLASWVGERRAGLPDQILRRLVSVRALVNKSAGEIPTLRQIARLGAGATRVQYQPEYPASYRLTIFTSQPLPGQLGPLLVERIEEATAAGVGSRTVSAIEDNYFGFSDDPRAKGFNVGIWAEKL